MRKLKVAFVGIPYGVLLKAKEIIQEFYNAEVSDFESPDSMSSVEEYDLILTSEQHLGRMNRDASVPLIVMSDTREPRVVYESGRSVGVRDWVTPDELYRLPLILRREILWLKEKKVHNWSIRYAREYSQVTGLINLEGLRKRLESMTGESFALITLEVWAKIAERTNKVDFLSRVADRILENLTPEDVVAHIEENKFAIVKREVASLNEVMDRIIGSLLNLGVEVSVGISISPRDGSHPQELILNSESALLKSKEGKTPIFFYSREVSEELERLEKLVGILRRIRHENAEEFFALCYQPIFSLRSKAVYGYEELLRMKDITLSHFDVPRILEIADRTDVLLRVEEWIIYKSLELAKKLEGREQKIFINISPRFIGLVDLYGFMKKAVDHVRASPNSVVLEITESHYVGESKRKELEKIRDLGIQIAIDDFGTKYNTLRFLKWVPADMVKIDRDLIKYIPESKEDTAFVLSIMRFCRDIQKGIIVEGIERREQLEFFESVDCDLGQGFFLGFPVREEKISELMDGS